MEADGAGSVIEKKLRTLARVLLPGIQAFFESEEGQREFAEWKKQRETEQQKQA